MTPWTPPLPPLRCDSLWLALGSRGRLFVCLSVAASTRQLRALNHNAHTHTQNVMHRSANTCTNSGQFSSTRGYVCVLDKSKCEYIYINGLCMCVNVLYVCACVWLSASVMRAVCVHMCAHQYMMNVSVAGRIMQQIICLYATLFLSAG